MIEARPGEALVVDADHGLLRQVVDTLTRNAVARASHVWLTTAPYEKWAVLDIGDDGPGRACCCLVFGHPEASRGRARDASACAVCDAIE